MTVSYHNKDELMEIECNACAKVEVFYGTFNECVQRAKKGGWVIQRGRGGVWKHFCSSNCKSEYTFMIDR
jgi:hypothetical protein